ncbi:MAG: hypothetical protein P8Y95_11545 [Gammaproteobacteria bacterium]|jgi:hypothetical protein
MAVLLSIFALALGFGCGAYLISSVEQGRPWALETVRAMGPVPAPARPHARERETREADRALAA